METGMIINKISHRLRRRSQAVQESIGISEAQGRILNYILAEGSRRNIYQKDIEEEFDLRPPTASSILRNLEKQEMISRVHRRPAEKTDFHRKSGQDSLSSGGRNRGDRAAAPGRHHRRGTENVSASGRENVSQS